MAEDWDLYAVVRSCKSATNNSTKAANITTMSSEEDSLSCLAELKFEEDNNDFPFSFPNFEEPKDNAFQELEQFYKTFLPNPTITTTTSSTNPIPNSFSVSEIGGSSGQHNTLYSQNQQQTPIAYSQNQQQTPIAHQFTTRTNGSYISGFELGHSQQVPKHQNQRINQRVPRSPSAINSQPVRSRKRKSQQKKIMCEVPQDNLSSDMWAWRKYGQKPIKGSPYPRNYYRCSSSKGCAARKQVERNSKNPIMFIVTYTGDHTHPRPTHRNSLAGSTRSKFTNTSHKSTTNKEETSTSASGFSPTTSLTVQTAHEEETTKQAEDNLIEKESEEDFDLNEDEEDEEEEEEDEDILIPNMAMSEDIFMGFQELGCGSPDPIGGFDRRSPDDSSDNFSDRGQFILGSWGSPSGGATVGGNC